MMIAMNSMQQNPDEFLKELGLDTLSKEDQAEALQMIEARFMDAVLTTVLSHVTDAEFEDFKHRAASDDYEDEVAEFVAQRPELADAIEHRLTEEYRLLKTAMAA